VQKKATHETKDADSDRSLDRSDAYSVRKEVGGSMSLSSLQTISNYFKSYKLKVLKRGEDKAKLKQF
jgi:hypothetical protein